MPDVFISYSRRDEDFVRKLHTALAVAERDVWIDWEDIPLSADWWQEICDGIESTNTFVLIVSPHSIASPVCNFEVAHALKHNKHIVPILREMVDEQAVFAQIGARRLSQGESEILGDRDLIAVVRQSWQAVAKHNWVYFNDDSQFQQSFEVLLKTVDTDLEHIGEHTQLLVRAREWEKSSHEPGLLLSGRSIDDAERWLSQAQSKDPAPTRLHSEFILASRQRQRRTGRRILTGALVLTVIALIAAVLAGFQTIAANNSASTAVANENTAVAAQATSERRAQEAQSIQWAVSAQQAMNNGDQSTALALALAAARIPNPPAEVQRTLADVAYAPGQLRQLGFYHTGEITAAALNMDGTAALTGASDGTIILWNAEIGKPERLFSVGSLAVRSVAFVPDLGMALAGTEDGTIILWDIEAGRPLRTIVMHDSPVTAIAINPEATRVLSSACRRTALALESCMSDTIVLWELNGDHELLRLPIPEEGTVTRLTFGADEQTVKGILCLNRESYLSTCTGGEIRTWNLNINAMNGNEVSLFTLPDGQYGDPALTSDGEFVVLVSCPDYQSNYSSANCLEGEMVRLNTTTGQEDQRISNGPAFSNIQIAVSADGQRVLSSACVKPESYGEGCEESELRLWDLESGTHLRSFDRPMIAIGDVVFSPDGRKVVLSSCQAAERYGGCQVADLLLFDVDTGALLRVLRDGSPGMASITFSPDGNTIIEGTCETSASDEPYPVCVRGKINLWSTDSGTINKTLLGHRTMVTSVAVSQDGAYLFSAACAEGERFSCSAGELILWDLGSGSPIRTMTGHSRSITSIAISPDGNQALSGSGFTNEDESIASGEIIVWNLNTGTMLRTIRGHTSEVTKLEFTADGRSILSSSADDTTVLWDLETGRAVNTFADQNSSVTSVAFQADGSAVLTANCASMVADGCTVMGDLILWDVERGVPERTFAGQRNLTISLAFSKDGHLALSGACGISTITIGCPYGYLTLWDMTNGALVQTLNISTTVHDIAFTADGQQAILPELASWDLASGALHPSDFQVEGVEDVAFSDDRRWLLAKQCVDDCGAYSTIMIDLENGEEQWVKGDSEAFALSPNGQTALASLCIGANRYRCDQHKIVAWDVETGAVRHEMSGQLGSVQLLGFLSDSTTAYAVDTSGVVMIWNVGTWQIQNVVRVILGSSSVPVAVSSDGRKLVTADCPFNLARSCETPSLSVWDMLTGVRLQTLVGHTVSATTAAFNVDGSLLVSGGCHRVRGEFCSEGELILWDVATGEPLRIFTGHSTKIDHVAFTPDGKHVVSIAESCTLEIRSLSPFPTCAGSEIRLWRVDSLNELVQWVYDHRVVRELNCAERRRFGFEPGCVDDVFPFPTPFVTWTPSPMPSATPTPDFGRETATLTFTPLPTFTPAPSVTPSG